MSYILQLITESQDQINEVISSIKQQIQIEAVSFSFEQYSDNIKQIEKLLSSNTEHILIVNAVMHQDLFNIYVNQAPIPSFTALVQQQENSQVEQFLKTNDLHYKRFDNYNASSITEYLIESLNSIKYQNDNEVEIIGLSVQSKPLPVVQQQDGDLQQQIEQLNKQLQQLQNQKSVNQQLVQENQQLKQQNDQLKHQLSNMKNPNNQNNVVNEQNQNQEFEESPILQAAQAYNGNDNQILQTITNSKAPPQGEKSPVIVKNANALHLQQIQKRQQVHRDRDNVHFDNCKQPVPRRLICGICLEPFKQPVTLSCGHSFCMRCLDIYEQFQYQENQGYDQEFQCPAIIHDLKNNAIMKQCETSYNDTPGVNLTLSREVQDLFNVIERLQVTDYVHVFEDDFGQIVQIEKEWYDVDQRKIVPEDIVRKAEMDNNSTATYVAIGVATVRTLGDNLIKTEIFNVAKLYPQFAQVCTRVALNDFVIKIQQPYKLDLKENMYYYQQQKFSPQYQQSYADSESPIYQIVGFNQNAYILRDKQGQLKKEQSLDSYISLLVQNKYERNTDISDICPGCYKKQKMPIMSTCGCYYCLYCLTKIIRNKLQCVHCLQQCGMPEVLPTPDLNQEIVPECFIEQDFVCIYQSELVFISHLWSDEEIIIQHHNSECEIVERTAIQPIDFSRLVPAFRPVSGDLCVQLNQGYANLSLVNKNIIIGLYKKSSTIYANALAKNIRLINQTELSDQMCFFCRQLIKRPLKLPCEHIVCRSCAILAVFSKQACFCCKQPFKFRDCEMINDQQIDIGTICCKKYSRVSSYGSTYGFIRQMGQDAHDVSFSSVTQKIEQYDLLFITQNVMLTAQVFPQTNDLCQIVQSADGLEGVYGLVLAAVGGRYKIMTEVGVVLENADVCKVNVNIKSTRK